VKKIDSNTRNNINHELPELVQFAAIQAAEECLAMSKDNERDFFSFVNNCSLTKAFNDLVTLRPRNEISEYTSIERFVERFFSLLIAKIVGARAERSPRQVDDMRKSIKTKLKSLLTELQLSGIDFDLHELLDMSVESTTIPDRRKLELSLFKTEVSAIPNFKTLLYPPKFSELLGGAKAKLDGYPNGVLLGRYDQVAGINYHFYGTTNKAIAQERELLFLFDSFCGNIPTCFWAFHEEIFHHDRDRTAATRGFRRWKQKWKKD
jgi:hypothetical protein